MIEKCHFIGIGGIGMSGLARILLEQKKEVSGSDLSTNTVTEELVKAGAQVYKGHSSQNISPGTTVVYGTDIKKDNVEYQAALHLKCPLIHRSELLQLLMNQQRSLAVAGTHGKTTTSSLLTWVLSQCSLNPSFAVGGIIGNFNTNASHGTGEYFVAEACESDGSFRNYSPFGAIVTNIDKDHMDYFLEESALVNAFKEFISKVSSKSHLFWCGDDPHLASLAPLGISYGFNESCALRASNFQQHDWKISFDVSFRGKIYSKIIVPLVGRHNALNALAVFGMAITLGADEALVRSALQSFKGVGRRCEKKGEIQKILVLDDYAHHPSEIRAALAGVRAAIKDRRLVVAYQPHRYTRAKDCIGLYGDCFEDADALFITEIYAAGEEPIPGITHESILQEVAGSIHVPRQMIAKTLANFLRPHDVLITLGAGDITKSGYEVLDLLKKEGVVKLKVGMISGGSSVEHDISLKSGAHIFESLRTDYYDKTSFNINREGKWIKEGIAEEDCLLSGSILQELQKCDIIFPVLHGTLGEDGTLQGFFEMLGKAYVGCNVSASAITMDKVLTKRLVAQKGLRSSPYVTFNQHQWKKDKLQILEQIANQLTYPLYVKPIHLGSSIGVQKVVSLEMLSEAIFNVFLIDTHVLVENEIVGRELEFALFGDDEITIYPPGEVCAHVVPYNFQNKYSKEGTPLIPRAELSKEKIEEGIQFARQAYEAVGCDGWARVDTFLDQGGNYWLNEINPIPGCTSCSLYPQMCQANGLTSEELVDNLILLGLKRKRRHDRLRKKT